LMAVSTPPALHEQYVRMALEQKIHVFAELPFVLDVNALADIARQALGRGVVLGVSATIRFYPPFEVIRKVLRDGRIGKPLYLEYSLGNHLAEWHPYEDYRKFYASDVKLGGAGMDMILHELAAIYWWMGDIASLTGRLSKVSSLEIAGPDTHDVLLTFRSGCKGYFHHDIIERNTIGRHIRIVGEEGTIEWDQNQPTIRLFTTTAQKDEQLPFDSAPGWSEALTASGEMTAILAAQTAASGKIPSAKSANYTYESNYLREMRHFVEAARGEHPYSISTIDEELKNVRAFHAIVQSSESLKETKLEN